MAIFHVAHLHEEGQDLLLVLVGHRLNGEELETLQFCAADAGLCGDVVPVWREGTRVGFLAPHEWHPFLRGFTWHEVLACVNRELTCG